MIRQPEREQLNRLTVKTLDQVFIMRGKEGLGCSQFEAEALTNLVKEVYFPWLSQPEAIQAGQLAMTAVSTDEPGHKPLSKCKMVPVILTLYAGEEDHRYRLSRKGARGTVALRRRQIVRMAHEALDQGALLTAEDLAFRIFNCGLRTISRDLKALAHQGIVVPLRSQQKDVGRALSHRVQAVELYLKRYTYTQIRQRIYHSLPSIANYVVTFAVVVAHTRDGHSVDEIAFLMQISPALVRQYQELYERYNTLEYRERINEIIAMVKARGFRPSQLNDEPEPSQAEKGGSRQ
jgi:hypothetical protein